MKFFSYICNCVALDTGMCATAYSGMYKRNFTEENAELRIITGGKRQPILTINGLSVPDWCEQKWKQFVNRNRSQRL